ncbi:MULTISPECIES: hypothetical protein [Sphingobium]|uniref:hypothetical protein n=1 Tax=Sphingobium TaxID=165695 RepID=UPI0015EC7889|nr:MULTISPECIES: hypothetical protein [Sphingobium]MCW2362430.1 hypothetical protein [Sphingobium sp. B10D3B]MCW2400891.1 hypothetical protein [Sphingobium sp. B10D7B]MCW2407869.1 hypothetical protein [Sphingobium xanthum]
MPINLPCPKCKKSIAYNAEVCPYCQTIFTPDDLKGRRNSIMGCCAIMIIVAILIAVTASLTIGEADNASNVALEGNSSISLAHDKPGARAPKEADLPPRTPLPAFAPPPPITGACLVADTALCETNRAMFDRTDWPKAWRGDYQAQRNVAFCLSTGCDGATEVNKMAACAWRMTILASAHSEAGDTDNDNLVNDCRDLSPVARAAAEIRADEIMKRISAGDSA